MLQFVSDSYSQLTGCSKTLHTAKIQNDLALLWLQGTNMKGVAEYDQQDRPLSNAFENEENVNELITDDNSYIKAKAMLTLAKVYLAKKQSSEADSLIEKAKQ